MNLQELKQSLFDAEDMTEIYAKIKRWAAEGYEEACEEIIGFVRNL